MSTNIKNYPPMHRRNPIAVLIWTAVTCGIYGIYWFAKTRGELKRRGAQDLPTTWLIILPLAAYWYFWRYANGVERATGGRYSNAVAFLLLVLLGPIGMAILQSAYNRAPEELPSTEPEVETHHVFVGFLIVISLLFWLAVPIAATIGVIHWSIDSDRAAHSFVDKIKLGNYDNAYDMLTSDRQSQISHDDFISQMSILDLDSTCNFAFYRIQGSSYNQQPAIDITGRIKCDGDQREADFIVVKNDGNEQIAKFDIE